MNRKIDSTTVGITLFILVCIACLIIFPIMLVKDIKASNKEYRKNILLVGKDVALSGDTLVIIDYIGFSEKYRLSNNVKIDASKIDKFLVK